MKDLLLQNCRLDERYDIHELLGRGSYAEIYVAKDIVASSTTPHNTVVIKALNVFLQNDLDANLERTLVENFQNEAIALDRVRHPNIISRLGHGTAQDLRETVFHYLVLEFMPGGDLARFCRGRNLSLLEALHYLEQVCAGLGHAHKNNIIHRDIKPQNILLSRDKKIVKIADFGVARLSLSDDPVTRVGTNIYAPPEHSPMFSGETQKLSFSDLTPAADVYSLAKTAYVLIAGESPRFFVNQPITELPHSKRKEPWADDLVKVLRKATQKDSRNRHPSVLEFWEELSELRKYTEPSKAVNTTKVTSELKTPPQAQTTDGFSDESPVKPSFNNSPKVTLDISGKKKPQANKLTKPETLPPAMKAKTPLKPKNPLVPPNEQIKDNEQENTESKPKRKFLKATATFVILVGLFAGSLFATYNYLIGNGNPIFGQTTYQMGTAKTNIHLRSIPSTKKKTKIGLITKGSRLKILQKNNKWYEIVITDHGRPKTNPDFSDRGWAYGKYIKIDE